MPAYDLPESVAVGGAEYDIRSDFRAVLDIMEAMGDPDLTDEERGTIALLVFYPEAESIPAGDLREAAERMMWFVRGGQDEGRQRGGRLMDWSQDFPLLIGPVSRVLGYDPRGRKHVHWWTFLAAYYEIGDCLFAQVVAVRRKRREGKRLDAQERRLLRENPQLVELRARESDREARIVDEWT